MKEMQSQNRRKRKGSKGPTPVKQPDRLQPTVTDSMSEDSTSNSSDSEEETERLQDQPSFQLKNDLALSQQQAPQGDQQQVEGATQKTTLPDQQGDPSSSGPASGSSVGAPESS